MALCQWRYSLVAIVVIWEVTIGRSIGEMVYDGSVALSVALFSGRYCRDMVGHDRTIH